MAFAQTRTEPLTVGGLVRRIMLMIPDQRGRVLAQHAKTMLPGSTVSDVLAGLVPELDTERPEWRLLTLASLWSSGELAATDQNIDAMKLTEQEAKALVTHGMLYGLWGKKPDTLVHLLTKLVEKFPAIMPIVLKSTLLENMAISTPEQYARAIHQLREINPGAFQYFRVDGEKLNRKGQTISAKDQIINIVVPSAGLPVAVWVGIFLGTAASLDNRWARAKHCDHARGVMADAFYAQAKDPRYTPEQVQSLQAAARTIDLEHMPLVRRVFRMLNM